MKSLIKNLIFILIASTTLWSCENEMLKSDYDYVPDASKLPSTVVIVNEVGGASVVCSHFIAFGADTSFIEKGFVISEDLEFARDTISLALFRNETEGVISHLKKNTDYFLKSYVLTRNGISYSDPQPITTIELDTLQKIGMSNLKNFINNMVLIDKDADSYSFALDSFEISGVKKYVMRSNSYQTKALTPENYMIFPSVAIPSNCILPRLTITLEALDPDFSSEVYKLIISDNPIDALNCRNAELLYRGILSAQATIKTVIIPAKYIGKTVYLGIAHYDCTDQSALIYKGHSVDVSRE